MLRAFITLSVALVLAQAGPDSTAARKVLANQQVTVWDLAWTPGRPAAVPDMPHDSVAVFLDAGTLRVRSADGPPQFAPRRQFDVVYEKPFSGRTVESVDHPVREILIGLEPGPSTAIRNTSAYPDAFPRPGSRLVLENDRVAVYEYTFVAGRPSPMHFHARDVVTIYTANGAVKSTTPSGEITVNDHFAGQVLFNPKNRTHTEELARGDVHIVVVELK